MLVILIVNPSLDRLSAIALLKPLMPVGVDHVSIVVISLFDEAVETFDASRR